MAVVFDPPLRPYSSEFLANGYERPFIQTNAWAAALEDAAPAVTCRWDTVQTIRRIIISFDSDYDHPMESVQMGHPESVVPFCVKHFRVLDTQQNVIFAEDDFHQSRIDIQLDEPVDTDSLKVEILETRGTPAALFNIRCF